MGLSYLLKYANNVIRISGIEFSAIWSNFNDPKNIRKKLSFYSEKGKCASEKNVFLEIRKFDHFKRTKTFSPGSHSSPPISRLERFSVCVCVCMCVCVCVCVYVCVYVCMCVTTLQVVISIQFLPNLVHR